jgi:hypothetical protein
VVWLVNAYAVTTAAQLAHASACEGSPTAAAVCYVATPGSIVYVSVQSNNSGGKDVDVHLKLAVQEFDDFPAYGERILPLKAGGRPTPVSSSRCSTPRERERAPRLGWGSSSSASPSPPCQPTG